MNEIKVIVAHPGKQHSFELATAMKRKGMLYKYITTVYDSDDSLTNRVKRLLKGNNLKKANSRKCEALVDDDVLQFCEIRALIFLLLLRIPHCNRLAYKWCRYVNAAFSKKVGNYAKKTGVNAVIMFDSTAENCFTILKREAPNITRIQDVSVATRHFMKFNFEKDPATEELKKEFPEFWDAKVMNGYQKEIDDTDYFLAASNMSVDSLRYCGADEKKIAVIPYGVNHEKFTIQEEPVYEGTPLRVIYVGQVSYRKGIHHLLKVIKGFEKDKIEVYLAGVYDPMSTLYKEYNSQENVHFLGFVTRDVLAERYQESDVFVFPTIGEGYGLVVLESLSCGVPVICSDLAGGNDAIIEGKNGFVFEAGNDEQLKDKIEWCINNRKALSKMRKFCRESALPYTWENYYDCAAETVKRMVNKTYGNDKQEKNQE